MRVLALITTLAGLAYALPQNVCSTVTTQVIVPTTTATYSSTDVLTIHATTARDLGTFTEVSTIKETNVLLTMTTTSTTCGATGTVSVPTSTVTVYPGGARKRADGPHGPHGPQKRASCTVTSTSYTTYGQTQVWVAAGVTSTYTAYTAYKQATVTSLKSTGTEHIIATETATTDSVCGTATVTNAAWTSTVSMDARCSPAAMTSAANGFGIEYLSDVPTTGATYETTTDDASACCQLCAEADQCAASAWDIRSGACKLEFPTAWDTGKLSCGQALLGYYDAGPNHPMEPGTGWFIAEICGFVQFGNAKPDDGT